MNQRHILSARGQPQLLEIATAQTHSQQISPDWLTHFCQDDFSHFKHFHCCSFLTNHFYQARLGNYQTSSHMWQHLQGSKMNGKSRAVTARAGQTRQPPHLAPDSTVCPTTRFLCLSNKNPLRKKTPSTCRQWRKPVKVRRIQGQSPTQLKIKLLRTVRKTKETKTAKI